MCMFNQSLEAAKISILYQVFKPYLTQSFPDVGAWVPINTFHLSPAFYIDLSRVQPVDEVF